MLTREMLDFTRVLNGLHLGRLKLPGLKQLNVRPEPVPSDRRPSVTSVVSHSSVSDLEGRKFRRDRDAELAYVS